MPACRRFRILLPPFSLLISKKHGNANGKKVKSKEQDALLMELIGYGGNLNYEKIAEMSIRSLRG